MLQAIEHHTIGSAWVPKDLYYTYNIKLNKVVNRLLSGSSAGTGLLQPPQPLDAPRTGQRLFESCEYSQAIFDEDEEDPEADIKLAEVYILHTYIYIAGPGG